MTTTTTDHLTTAERSAALVARLTAANAECEAASSMDIAFYSAAIARRREIQLQLEQLAAEQLTPPTFTGTGTCFTAAELLAALRTTSQETP